MTDQIFDLIASLFVLTGALLCFGAAVSLVRFPARGAYRAGLIKDELLIVDHLTEDLETAGYTRPADSSPESSR